MRILCLSTAVALALVSCITVPETPDYDELSGTQTQTDVRFDMPDSERRSRTNSILSGPVDQDAALELALLNNPGFRADYLGLRSAQGRFYDNAALSNPGISAAIFDVEGEDITNLAYGLHYTILDLIWWDRRYDMAEADLALAEAEARLSFLDRTTTVRKNWVDAIAAEQTLGLMTQAEQATTAAQSAAQAMYDAGNIPKLDLDREKLMAAEVAQMRREAELAAQDARIALATSLGLPASRAADLDIPGRLPAPKTGEALELQAVKDSNLGLTALEAQISRQARSLGITDISSLFGDADVEFERERDDGEWERGIGVSFELPIFNTGAGARQAARSDLDAMVAMKQMIELEIENGVERFNAGLDLSEQTIAYHRQTRLPLTGQILQGMQLDYNAMQVGVFDLLNAKRAQLQAGQDYISALAAYHKMLIERDAIVAGAMPTGGMSLPQTNAGDAPADTGGH